MINKPIALAIIILVCLVSVGCVSSDQLREQASQARQLSEQAGTLAEKIQNILASNPPENVEDGTVAGLIRSAIQAVNGDWVEYFDDAVSIAGDVRVGAVAFVQRIPDLQANINQRAIELDKLADENSNAFGNTIGLVVQYGLAIFGSGGIAAGVLGTIRAVKATRDTENIVSSIQASPAMRAALDGDGGSQVRAAMPTGTQKVVKKIKDSI